jgi:hypothetical protein
MRGYDVDKGPGSRRATERRGIGTAESLGEWGLVDDPGRPLCGAGGITRDGRGSSSRRSSNRGGDGERSADPWVHTDAGCNRSASPRGC